MLIMKGPHSYTAEDVLEIQCHGGRKALEEILGLVLAHGARMANPGEFTQRAFVNGRIDLAQAEAVMDVIQAKSRQGLTSAVNQLEGRLSKVIGAMRHDLTDFITRLEVTIDYPEEDLEDITVPDVAGAIRKQLTALDDMLEASHDGRIIRDGVMAAIAGTPNAGKSSLLNALDASFGIATGAVSERLGRGKHTTRHVELYALGADTFVADTPGFASFEVDMVDPISCENLQYAFREFRPYIGQCRFRDCAHLKEPGCAVLAAVAAGKIAPERHESYARLYALSAQVNDWEKKK